MNTYEYICLCEYIWLGNICDPLLNLPTKSVSKFNLPIAPNYEGLKKLVGVMKKILGNSESLPNLNNGL